MSVSNGSVAGRDLLDIPRRGPLGRFLGRWEKVPAAARYLRVRRKRFIAGIKGSARQSLIGRILKHPAGREFQAVLENWSRSPSIVTEAPVIPAAGGARRCSVVINTVDRAGDLSRTLADLQPGWDAARDELIVVLGPTRDESREIVRHSPVPCVLIDCPERNLAISRNLGVVAATGRHVAFIDDDASPSPGWLDALLAPLDGDPSLAVSAGFVLDGQGASFLNRYVVADTLGRAFWLDDLPAAEAKLGELGPHRSFLTATGCNMAFRRDALVAVGGFDPFYRYFLEETDLVRRLLDAGHGCGISPESTVLHRLGSNLARTPSFEPADRAVIVRSQVHYIGKFGKATWPPAALMDCLWERVLLDLEKIAWDCRPGSPQDPLCADLQALYLAAVTRELRLDSTPDSSSLSVPL